MGRFDPRRIRLLLFDLDGTLSDSSDDLLASMVYAIGQLDLTPVPPQVVRARMGRGIVSQLRNEARDQGRADLAEELVAVFRDHYVDHCLDTTKVFPDALDTLGNLPHKKAIVTNKPSWLARRVVEALGLMPHIHLLVGTGDPFDIKPDPAMINHALKTMDADPVETIMIGDTLADIISGKNAGVWTCAVGGGFAPLEELRAAGPDLVVEKLSELLVLFSG